MSDRIKENIRYYLPNDPYHHDVDNLPLRDLVDNDKRLQTQVDDLINASKAGAILDTSRRNLSELRPHVIPGQPGKVFVNPGTFMARIDSPSKNQTGIYEKHTGWNGTNETNSHANVADKSHFTTDSRRANGAARTSVVRLLSDETGANPWVQIPEWSTDDFAGTAPGARVDLVYIKASRGFEDEAFSTDKPTLGVLKGAGQIAEEQLTRHLGKPVNEIFAHSEEDVDVATNWISVPLPEDIMNREGRAERTVASNISWDGASVANIEEGNGFVLPLCYVIVTSNFTGGTAISPSNVIDIRPFLRTTELTLNERQAILNSQYLPRVNNAFVTTTELRSRIEEIPNPDIPGDYGIKGAIRFYTSENDGTTLDTKPITVPPGKYIVWVAGKAGWTHLGALNWAIVNTATGDTLDAPGFGEDGATREIEGDGDDDCHFMDFIDVVIPSETSIEARGSEFDTTYTVTRTKRRWFRKKKYTTTHHKKGTLNCQRMILIKYGE